MLTAKDSSTGIPGTLKSTSGALQVVVLPDAAVSDKRAFRAYREFTANTTLRFVAAKPFLLTAQALWTGQGISRAVVSTGGTETGTWTVLPTKFGINLLDGAVPGNTVISFGGTHAGGAEREVLRSDSSTAGGGQGNLNQILRERLLPAGTYYITITVTGTTQGMYSLEWTELP